MKSYQFIFNKVSALVFIGIVGFFLAIWMLTGKDQYGDLRYKEIVLVNKDTVLNEIFHNRIAALRDTLRKMQISEAKKKEKATEITAANRVLFNTLRDSINLSVGNPDTAVKYFAVLMGVNRNSLREAITSAGWKANTNQIEKIRFTYIDSTPSLYHLPVSKTVVLKLKRESHGQLMDFFAANPLFGFWLIFSIAQMTLWFLVVPLLYGMLESLGAKMSNMINKVVTPGNWVISSILPFLFFGIFGYVFYWCLIDGVVIRDHYFLAGFNQTMLWYAGFGYIAAIACFGMYLMTSRLLDALNEKSKTQGLRIAANNTLQSDYQALKKTFEASFLASAIILSVFVLWVGIAFNSINQTEVMRFYGIYAGKPFLPYDFVFLIGAMHTVILLLFYIPVRLKFNNMEITEDAIAAAAQAGGTGKKIINSLWESILAILITSAPLITSVIQKLISSALAG